MAKLACPECDTPIDTGDDASAGDIITCEECGTDLELDEFLALRVYDDDVLTDEDFQDDNDYDEEEEEE